MSFPSLGNFTPFPISVTLPRNRKRRLMRYRTILPSGRQVSSGAVLSALLLSRRAKTSRLRSRRRTKRSTKKKLRTSTARLNVSKRKWRGFSLRKSKKKSHLRSRWFLRQILTDSSPRLKHKVRDSCSKTSTTASLFIFLYLKFSIWNYITYGCTIPTRHEGYKS